MPCRTSQYSGLVLEVRDGTSSAWNEVLPPEGKSYPWALALEDPVGSCRCCRALTMRLPSLPCCNAKKGRDGGDTDVVRLRISAVLPDDTDDCLFS